MHGSYAYGRCVNEYPILVLVDLDDLGALRQYMLEIVERNLSTLSCQHDS